MFLSTNFIATSLINFLVMTTYYLVFVISGPYTMEMFDASASVGGFVAGLMLFGCLTGRFFTGRIIAAVGFRPVLFASLLAYAASTGLYLVAGSLPALMLIRFISGMAVGCIGTVTGTMIVHIVPPHMHGRGISYFSLSTVLALALGPFLGIFLRQFMGFQTLFLVCLILALCASALAIFLSFPHSGRIAAEKRTGKNFQLENYMDRAVMPIGMVTLLVALCYGSVQAFLAFHAEQSGLVDAASAFFLLYAIASFCSRPFTGRLFDSKGANIVVYPALCLSVCGLALLGLVTSSVMLLISGILLGIGIGNFQTMAQAISIKLVPPERFAQATSTYFIFLDTGIGIGPPLLGLLVPDFGYRGLYLTTAFITLGCLPLYYALHGRKKAAAGDAPG